jgi:hypothetical protein
MRTPEATSSTSSRNSLRHEASGKVTAGRLHRIRSIVEQRTIDEYALRAAVDAEWIRRPDHDVSVLAGFERARQFVDAERLSSCG